MLQEKFHQRKFILSSEHSSNFGLILCFFVKVGNKGTIEISTTPLMYSLLLYSLTELSNCSKYYIDLNIKQDSYRTFLKKHKCVTNILRGTVFNELQMLCDTLWKTLYVQMIHYNFIMFNTILHKHIVNLWQTSHMVLIMPKQHESNCQFAAMEIG